MGNFNSVIAMNVTPPFKFTLGKLSSAQFRLKPLQIRYKDFDRKYEISVDFPLVSNEHVTSLPRKGWKGKILETGLDCLITSYEKVLCTLRIS